MNKTLGAPSFARSGCGQAGCDTSNVLPITPLNAVPGLYSLSAIFISSISFVRLFFFQKKLLSVGGWISTGVRSKTIKNSVRFDIGLWSNKQRQSRCNEFLTISKP